MGQGLAMMKEKDVLKQFFGIIEDKYNIDVKVIRIFNTYGPRMQPNDGRVVSNFIIQALKNRI